MEWSSFFSTVKPVVSDILSLRQYEVETEVTTKQINLLTNKVFLLATPSGHQTRMALVRLCFQAC
ncbi:hypothetical protein ACXYTC_20700, partial [Escherichia coli]